MTVTEQNLDALRAGDIATFLRSAPGFVRTLGAEVQSSGPALLRLDADPSLFNHLGGPHAAAIFGLGETTAFVVLLHEFRTLVLAGAIPLVKGATIAYRALATGPLLAAAALVPAGQDPDPVRAGVAASLAERGRARFDVEVRFRREADDIETAVATYTMALLRG